MRDGGRKVFNRFGQEMSVIMQFRNFRGKFAFHCHNSSHEDFDMTTQFEVV